MSRPAAVLVTLAALGALGCGAEPPSAPSLLFKASQGGGGGASTDIPVTATIADADGSVAASLQITSDGQGSYQNSSSLSSVIQPIGAWVLDSYTPRSGTRTMGIDFSRPVTGSAPGGADPVAPTSGSYRARFLANCPIYGVTMQGIAAGASITCPLHIGFAADGNSYALQMNPVSGSQGSYAETDAAVVTCVTPASGSGACTGWHVTPSGAGGNVAKLLQYVTVKGKQVAMDRGDFVVAFSISVTR